MKEKKTVGRIPEPAERTAVSAAAAPKSGKARRILIPLVLLAAIATGAFLVWKRFFAIPPVPENLVALGGSAESGEESCHASADDDERHFTIGTCLSSIGHGSFSL